MWTLTTSWWRFKHNSKYSMLQVLGNLTGKLQNCSVTCSRYAQFCTCRRAACWQFRLSKFCPWYFTARIEWDHMKQGILVSSPAFVCFIVSLFFCLPCKGILKIQNNIGIQGGSSIYRRYTKAVVRGVVSYVCEAFVSWLEWSVEFRVCFWIWYCMMSGCAIIFLMVILVCLYDEENSCS